MRHTPAPWTLQQLETNRNGYDWPTFAIRSPQNCCLATVGTVDRYHADDNEANAHLMAAAPDMLAALEYVIGWNSDSWDADIARDMAVDAIAKAKEKRVNAPRDNLAELRSVLKDARIALVFYRKYLESDTEQHVTYPFGIEVEGAIRAAIAKEGE
uniref:Uncharacterized protein n=1 Tax=viral metagenome TaxID=1070528 RepID=A0A6M3LFN2_9ZZZZ